MNRPAIESALAVAFPGNAVDGLSWREALWSDGHPDLILANAAALRSHPDHAENLRRSVARRPLGIACMVPLMASGAPGTGSCASRTDHAPRPHRWPESRRPEQFKGTTMKRSSHFSLSVPRSSRSFGYTFYADDGTTVIETLSNLATAAGAVAARVVVWGR